MNRAIFEGKPLGETENVTFNYLSRLAVGETISSASVTAAVYSGSDPSPGSIVSGTSSISASVVTQAITGGVLGVTYKLTCTALTSAGQTLLQSGFLCVVPDLE